MTPDQLAKSGSEHAHQRALFAWANMAEKFGLLIANAPNSYVVKGYAESYDKQGSVYKPITKLKWLHAIHNQGHGDVVRGGNAKAEGVKAGVWDIFLPVPITNENEVGNGIVETLYCGLYIEMKVGNNKLTDKQIEFQNDNPQFCFAVCYTWQEGRDAILKYLGLS